jgi:Outer membrane efflux protein
LKNLILLLFISACAGIASAQQTDFNNIVLPVESKAKDITEYLVQLAWLNNPNNSVLQEEVKKSKDELKLVKKDWLKDFQVNFNLNQSNLAKNPVLPQVLYNQLGTPIRDIDDNLIPISNSLYNSAGVAIPLKTAGGSAFYPKYNFLVTLNLGNLISQKNKNQVKRHDIVIADHRVNQQKLIMRGEVLMRYAQFKMAKEIVKSRTQIEQDANANNVLVSELFKKDERTFEEYNKASSIYYEAKELRMKAEIDSLLAKIKLEEIIGLKWEQVTHPQKDQ